MRIDHVQVAMPDGGEGEARSFYRDVVGMTEVEKPEPLRSRGGCWFVRDSCHVHLGIDPEFRPARKAHPAFLSDELEALAERLGGAGYPVKWSSEVPGTDRFYTEDPFGNRIEFLRMGHGFSEAEP